MFGLCDLRSEPVCEVKIMMKLFSPKTAIVDEFPADAVWFKANINGTGFYRVNYPEHNWDALIRALDRDHAAFSTADRAQLINDAFALSE